MSNGPRWMQCPVCKETISWEIPKDALKDVARFPAAIVIKHHDHYLVCYVDSHNQLADTEVASVFIEAGSK
ncbi:MAG: hypothetical protein ACTSYL_01265 [Candidatus Thorarchaeota archaeon]